MPYQAAIHRLAQRNPGDIVEIVLNAELPFVPTAGLMLKLNPPGILHEIDYVIWSIATPDRLELHITEPGTSEEYPDLPTMIAHGWLLNELADEETDPT